MNTKNNDFDENALDTIVLHSRLEEDTTRKLTSEEDYKNPISQWTNNSFPFPATNASS